MKTNKPHLIFLSLSIITVLVSACATQAATPSVSNQVVSAPTATVPAVTPMPTRPAYKPGELVEYIAQTGDTLPAIAAHFNTTVEEIMAANPIIPTTATTMPPGLPMQIPIYYRDFWGSPYRMIPDSLFINGPAAVGFDTEAFVGEWPGWLKNYVGFAAGETRSGAQIVDYVASNFSVSPRLLLALLEYQSGALSQSILSAEKEQYPLGNRSRSHQGLYLQLVWAANELNDGYYKWRTGDLTEFDRSNGRLEVIDPWQNAATASLHVYFNQALPASEFNYAVSAEGFGRAYAQLFGDPWENPVAHIEGSLEQPLMRLPFEPGKSWAHTGGPHTGWGTGAPFAALDFAPPSVVGGCIYSDQWTTAVADGLVVRSETGIVMLDLDEDGDDRTGWVILYLHVGTEDRVPVGTYLKAGDPVGHPSCEGGTSTGSHVHVARKYNGEWMVADSALPFVMEGWVPQAGEGPYEGTLTRFQRIVTACECSTFDSQLVSQGTFDGSPAEPLDGPTEEAQQP
ncbi:MAG: LysM peptidoglycan-binding domain-containing protein [Chloroflexi bacterium]|nr:MAG: LysM peptidoglycan-binding domain-containing protein [Chloroflexota bacterium]MBL1194914.1 LysM peptidoglycan-binding domain-containing protein [Chloroflexota bacterium]NOH12205.1 LysM peptidoglycan-binding domain-containing protein [Chloroflexota bacterium]